jgi:hypothetical protein
LKNPRIRTTHQIGYNTIGYKCLGFYQSEEDVQNSPRLLSSSNLRPGDLKYEDVNGDGIIDSNDMITIARTLPDFTYSWNNNFRFKNVTLNVLMIGVQGNDIVNLGRFLTEEDNDGLSRKLLNRWTPENENTDIPGHDTFGNQRNSSRWVEDGSFLRVKNITFGYDFPSALLKKVQLKSLRAYVTGTNLLTFTKYTGYDPEANNNSHAPSTGFDMGSYPSQRRYTVGLNITF